MENNYAYGYLIFIGYFTLLFKLDRQIYLMVYEIFYLVVKKLKVKNYNNIKK